MENIHRDWAISTWNCWKSSHPPDFPGSIHEDPWEWYIYLQEWLIFMINVYREIIRPHGNPSWMIVNLPLFTRSSSFLTYHLGITKRIQKGHLKPVFKLNKNAISGCFRQFSSDFEAVCRGTLAMKSANLWALWAFHSRLHSRTAESVPWRWIQPPLDHTIVPVTRRPMTKTSTEPIQPWFEEQRSGLVDFLTIFVEAYN